MAEAEPEAAPTSPEDFDRAMRADLDRRIAALAQLDEGAFGRLTMVDVLLGGGLFVALPLALIWFFA